LHCIEVEGERPAEVRLYKEESLLEGSLLGLILALLEYVISLMIISRLEAVL
jgi:hypothetical protein